MKFHKTRICISCLVFTFFFVTLQTMIAQTNEFVVAPNGNDTHPGTKEKPFATLYRARDAVRALKKKSLPSGGVTIRLRGGLYHLGQTLELTEADSGTAECPITYAAFTGEKPVVSGGQRIRGWKKLDQLPSDVPATALGKLWQVKLPDIKSGKMHFMQLFTKEARLPRSRLPESGYYTMKRPNGDLAFEYRPGQFASWKNIQDIEAVVFHKWDEARFFIRQHDQEERIVRFKKPDVMGSRIGKHSWFMYRLFYLENVRAGLSSPGRWHLDTSTGSLLLWPPDSMDPNAALLVAPRLHCLMRIQGSKDKPVAHIRFNGITFAHNEWPLPGKGFAGHWSDSQPISAAVQVANADHVRISGCTFRQLGTYAIRFGEKVTHSEISHNQITDMGSGGILIRGIGEDLKPKDPQPNTTRFNTISDNHIYNLGKLYPSGTGIVLSEASDCTVSHNHLHDMFYIGIGMGASARFPKNPRGRRNRVEYNDIHDIMQLLSDGAGIYTWGFCNKSIVHHNRIRNSGGGPISWQRAFGIHLDEPTTGICIEYNLVNQTRRAGMRWHKTRKVSVRNNIFAFAQDSLLSANKNTGNNPFERNIIYGSPKKFFENMRSSYKTQFKADFNIYWDPQIKHTPTFPVKNSTFTQWQKLGQDTSSLVTDPLFENPAELDFTLKKNSPAFKLGFKPIELGTVGPRQKTAKGQP